MNSDFFDQLEVDLCDALKRGAHMSGWRRAWLKHSRALLGLFAVLVIATPALAAITGVFSQGAPNPFPEPAASSGSGLAIPREGRLLSLRVADPAGGLPWGLRLIRTSRGDTCVQLGRIQDGQLGSLGIDHYWADDGQFHAILPNDEIADECGSTDADGYGFVSTARSGASASAGMAADTRGPAADFCRVPGDGTPADIAPACPAGSERFIFYGLLGPDAVSITYRTATGGTASQVTSGGVGAYLIVEPWNDTTCKLFSPHVLAGSSCPTGASSGDDNDVASDNAILSIHYRDGYVCDPSQTTPCPFLGYLTPKQPPITAAQISSPITVQQVPATHYCQSRQTRVDISCPRHLLRGETPISTGTYLGMHPSLLVNISFIARRAITTDNSSYTFTLRYPNCGGQSTSAETGGGTTSDIRAGQRIHWQAFVAPTCHGVYAGTISYTPDQGPEGGFGGGTTNQTTITVGNFSLRVK